MRPAVIALVLVAATATTAAWGSLVRFPVERASHEELFRADPHSAPPGGMRLLAAAQGSPRLRLDGGPAVGIYRAVVGIGTPPQKMKLILDTGSSDLVVVDKMCFACDPLMSARDSGLCVGPCPSWDGGSPYDPDASSTAVRLPVLSDGEACTPDRCAEYCNSLCQCVETIEDQSAGRQEECGVEVAYGDGSSGMGAVAQDIVGLLDEAGQYRPGYNVMCTISKLYRTGVAKSFPPADTNGILGFSSSSSAQSNQPPYFTQLYLAGAVSGWGFGVTVAEDGGSMTLGSPDTSAYVGGLHYVELMSAGGLYQVPMGQIHVGKFDHFDVSAFSTVVDTGSTAITLPTHIFEDLKKAIQKGNCHIQGLCSPEGETVFDLMCFYIDDADIRSLPTLDVEIGHVTVGIPPETYMMSFGEAQDGRYCRYAGLMDGEDTLGDGTIILGDPFFRSVYTYFDIGNRKFGMGQLPQASSQLTVTSSQTLFAGVSELVLMGGVVAGLMAVFSVVVWVFIRLGQSRVDSGNDGDPAVQSIRLRDRVLHYSPPL